MAFHCCVNESHFVSSVSVLLLSSSQCVRFCVFCPLSLSRPPLFSLLFLMENKDWRVAEIGLQMKNMESVTRGQGLSIRAPESLE